MFEVLGAPQSTVERKVDVGERRDIAAGCAFLLGPRAVDVPVVTDVVGRGIAPPDLTHAAVRGQLDVGIENNVELDAFAAQTLTEHPELPREAFSHLETRLFVER